MQSAATFLDAGWDFVDETANGTEDVWWISEGPNYPRLSWESRRYGGGRGEPNDPYLIFTAQQMNAIGTEPNDWDKHFQLGADLDLAGFDGQAGRPEFHPAGTGYNKAFVGVFDGLGHTVRNFTCHMDKGQGVGLFGFLGPHGEVKDLVVQDANVSGDSFVGALVGYNHRGTVRHCRATGHVQGSQYTGGLIGICIDQALTERCHSEVHVSGGSPTGGLVGANSGSTVSQCAVTGTVKGTGGGGITGRQDNHSLIQDSYAVCTMSGGGSGIAGANKNSLVSRCYFAGVFVCPEPQPLRDATSPISVAASECGSGLVGFNTDGQVEVSFWDIQTSGATTSAGGTGKTTVEMQTASTFLDAGWDFVGETINGTEDIWWIDEGKDYPRLWWKARNR